MDTWVATMPDAFLPNGIATATIAAEVVVVWLMVAAAVGRRRQLRRGEIRPLEGSWTTVEGRRVFARAAVAAADPDRLPVVLVHGLGVSGTYLVPTAERLATEFAVHVPDLPGHGRSEAPREPMDIPRLADALIAWMDAAGLDRVAIVANSMGCQIVVDAALRHPDRVERIVLTGSSSDPAARTAAEHAWRLIRDIPFEHPGLIGVVLVDYLRMGPRILGELRAMLRDRMEDKLPRVAVPAMLVAGEHDPICPRRWLDEAAELVGAERVAVIPWWGHAVNYSAPRPLVELIASFLRAARRRTAGIEVDVRWAAIAGRETGGRRRGTAFEGTGAPRYSGEGPPPTAPPGPSSTRSRSAGGGGR